MMKLVGTVVLVVALLGVAINGVFGEELNPADYPECMEIVDNLGTSPDALCSDSGNVIDARSYPLWDSYHPWE